MTSEKRYFSRVPICPRCSTSYTAPIEIGSAKYYFNCGRCGFRFEMTQTDLLQDPDVRDIDIRVEEFKLK